MNKATAKNVIQAESNSTEMTMGIKTIFVKGSDSKIYFELLKHRPVDAWEKRFKKNLRKAIKLKYRVSRFLFVIRQFLQMVNFSLFLVVK